MENGVNNLKEIQIRYTVCDISSRLMGFLTDVIREPEQQINLMTLLHFLLGALWLSLDIKLFGKEIITAIV